VQQELTCAELVERITDYLEGALTPDEVSRVREHLAMCDGCTAHLEQMRTALRLLRAQPPERASRTLEDQLAGAFRAWARERSGP
jgi:anti-sigma factor RsiW